MTKKGGLILLIFLLGAVGVFADHLGESHTDWNGLDLTNVDLLFSDWSVKLIVAASLLIALLTVIALKGQKKLKNKHKVWLFVGIAIPAILVSLFISGSTVFVNVISTTGGPVHWHTDFEVYKCGEKLDLIDATGFSNRLGTPKFHEHGENRIHIEGTVVRTREVNLQSFFDVIGGVLTSESYVFPTNNGLMAATNGEDCNGQPGKVQVFKYEILNPDPTQKTGLVYRQTKLENFGDYLPAPFFNIPPGDCLIIEFAPEKEQTEHICETYKIGIDKGDLSGS